MYFDGLTQSQIAEKTGLPLGTVKSRTLLGMRGSAQRWGDRTLSTRDHSTIEELLAGRALGGLDGADDQLFAQELASHGDCDRCRQLEGGSPRSRVGWGFLWIPCPSTPGMADRIIVSTSESPEAPRGTGRRLAERRNGGRGRALGVPVTIAAALALLVGGAASC